MNHDEIAAAISEALGFEVRHVPLGLDEWRARMEKDLNFPPFMVQQLHEAVVDHPAIATVSLYRRGHQ